MCIRDSSKDEDTGYVRAVNILEGAPAEKVDIQPDDIIVQIDDHEITTDDEMGIRDSYNIYKIF